MATIRREIQVNAPAASTWALVGPVTAIADWHPAIAKADSPDGSTRTCVMPDGAQIHEAIRAHSDAERAYTYEITESPLPVAEYVSTLSVKGNGHTSQIVWECSYQPLAPEADVAAMLTEVYDVGLQSAKTRLES